jgi:hypothetical protein
VECPLHLVSEAAESFCQYVAALRRNQRAEAASYEPTLSPAGKYVFFGLGILRGRTGGHSMRALHQIKLRKHCCDAFKVR